MSAFDRAPPSNAPVLNIAVFEGDGIGPEVMAPTVTLVTKAAARAGVTLDLESLPAGAAHYARHGEALPPSALKSAEAADAILLSAMGLPDVRYADGTEISPQIELRFAMGLYAGVRPVMTFPGQPCPLADARARALDFVLIRESTEGLFHSHARGTVTEDREAREILLITRDTSERLFDFAFALARSRKDEGRGPGTVTCVDKANVFKAFAFFRRIFRERAALHPDLAAEVAYVDATALSMVQRPWEFDVLVTENMFGDILSDLGAGLMGGLGFAPSADIGDDSAVFQPCHGSAPDIAGQGIANPAAMILSGAMMLDWLGRQRDHDALVAAGQALRQAVGAAIASGSVKTRDMGGRAGTEDFARAVEDHLG
ncbi:MAG: isocitrate/isopropylmalate family dehydrogenase [Pseudomonadota bacterium]